MHENKLTDAAEELVIDYEESRRKKQAKEEIPLEVMTKAVEVYNTVRKTKLKAIQIHSRKAAHYKVNKS